MFLDRVFDQFERADPAGVMILEVNFELLFRLVAHLFCNRISGTLRPPSLARRRPARWLWLWTIPPRQPDSWTLPPPSTQRAPSFISTWIVSMPQLRFVIGRSCAANQSASAARAIAAACSRPATTKREN